MTRYLTIPFILLIPLASFLKHHHYSLLREESLLILLGTGGFGLFLSLLGRIAGKLPTLILLSAAITLLFDIHHDGIRLAWHFGVFFLVVFIAAFLLRKHIHVVGTAVFGTMLLATLIMPGQGKMNSRVLKREPTPAKSTLPLVIHLILDEHIGIDGIPDDSPLGQKVQKTLKEFYLSNGFRVFAKAYSRYYNSPDSIPNLLNLTAHPLNYYYFHGDLKEGSPMARNRYFRSMANLGYRRYVYQTDFIDFCQTEDGLKADGCFTYELETIKAIEETKLAPREKIKIILGMIGRLSVALRPLAENWQVGRVSTVSTLPVFDQLKADLREAKRGEFYFAHMAIPHFPYALDKDCKIRPQANSWLYPGVPGMKGKKNTKESRAKRYEHYLEQVLCAHKKTEELLEALKKSGHFDDALILIHSDHGSRIDIHPPTHANKEKLTKRDLVDAFSSLFVAKLGKATGFYNEQLLPIDLIFKQIVTRKTFPADPSWAGPSKVFLMARDPKPHPMVLF